MKIYLASSWRNNDQPKLVEILRNEGHEVYDFRDDNGFNWKDVNINWKNWSIIQFLKHPIAIKGFTNDFNAMQWADVCVLLNPCGRSAHLEAGYFVGVNKPLYILLHPNDEPELMYSMATKLCVTTEELIECLI